MKNIQQIKNKKLQKEMLIELWENAAFNPEAYNLLEKLAKYGNTHRKTTELSRIIPQDSYFELATIRNRNLISYDEQQELKKTIVGFFGLSVGSHAAITWMMESRADIVKIADPDTISPTNLNRLRFGWNNVGELKIDVVKEKLLEIHPFAEVITTTKTLEKDIKKIFDQQGKIHIVVDAIDDMNGKIYLRKLAKERHIPLLSAADVGDNVILDIERYDQDPQPELFLGRVPNIENINFSTLSDIERKKLIIKLVGFEDNSVKMLDSLLSIGKSIATWPQLGATATIAGGIIATTIKKIILKENVKSGRYYFSLDKMLVSDYNTNDITKQKKSKINQIKTNLHLD